MDSKQVVLGGERCTTSEGERNAGRCEMTDYGYGLRGSVCAIASPVQSFRCDKQAKQGVLHGIFRVKVFRKFSGARRKTLRCGCSS